jgi:hypothetical protein
MSGEAHDAWASLEPPWRACLELAWSAYGAGTIPVGAAVTDAAGTVIAEGVGTAVMATVGRIAYAGADPYGGGSESGLAGVDPHVERVQLRLDGPRPDRFGRLASALLLAFFLRRRPEGHVVAAYATHAPVLRPVAEALLHNGAPETAAAGVPLAEALADLWDALAGGVR